MSWGGLKWKAGKFSARGPGGFLRKMNAEDLGQWEGRLRGSVSFWGGDGIVSSVQLDLLSQGLLGCYEAQRVVGWWRPLLFFLMH